MRLMGTNMLLVALTVTKRLAVQVGFEESKVSGIVLAF